MSERRRIPESEAELVEAFCSLVEKRNARIRRDRENAEAPPHWREQRPWTIYREACGWDLLLAEDETGVQVGIEAKLCLNAKVISQALPHHRWFDSNGPDYRAVLVPSGGRNLDLRQICDCIGLTVLSIYDIRGGHGVEPEWALHQPSQLPDEQKPESYTMEGWHWWGPAEREKLPEYIPDVAAGVKSPIQLTEWKLRAIKLWIILDRRGVVTRGDMKALGLSPTRFTDRFNGFLAPDPRAGGYVRHDGSPDFRRQHPRVYGEVEADWEKWVPAIYRDGFPEPIR